MVNHSFAVVVAELGTVVEEGEESFGLNVPPNGLFLVKIASPDAGVRKNTQQSVQDSLL